MYFQYCYRQSGYTESGYPERHYQTYRFSHPDQKQRGYTLGELLVSVSIFALLASFALPAFSSLIRNTQSTITINTLASAFQLARSSAITDRQVVVVCAQDENETRCGKDWLQGTLVFTDPDNNRTLDTDKGERLLARLDPPPPGSQLVLKAALKKSYLRFMSNGMLENTAGSLVYCPPHGKDTDARNLIFSRNGRLRTGTDKNHDNIREDADGQPLRCPLADN